MARRKQANDEDPIRDCTVRIFVRADTVRLFRKQGGKVLKTGLPHSLALLEVTLRRRKYDPWDGPDGNRRSVWAGEDFTPSVLKELLFEPQDPLDQSALDEALEALGK